MTTKQTKAQPETRPSEVRSDALLDASRELARALDFTTAYRHLLKMSESRLVEIIMTGFFALLAKWHLHPTLA